MKYSLSESLGKITLGLNVLLEMHEHGHEPKCPQSVEALKWKKAMPVGKHNNLAI